MKSKKTTICILPALALCQLPIIFGFLDTNTFAQNELKKTEFVATCQYEIRMLEGWKIHLNRHLLTDKSELGKTALVLLHQKLLEIKHVLPAKACSKLQAVPIWLGVNDGSAPCSEYHPSREWLKEHGFNPDKAKSVEIGNAELFIEYTKIQPMLLLHEFAHAYQDQIFGWENNTIKELYRQAVRRGLYRSVLYYDGSYRRAYALTNQRELFAECSEAYFGRNDFFPFTRSDLKKYNPEMFRLVKQAWEL